MCADKSEILLISDLHLSAERPAMIELFSRFVHERAVHARALYILGDFFEYWVGDDDPALELSVVFKAFKRLSDADVPIYFQHGNRDFLAAEQFAQRSGCHLIEDYYTTDFFGTRVMLMHGDSLCTDDVKYQEFKSLVRSAQWQQDFLDKPLAERKAIVEQLRQTSKAETQSKHEDIMDVNQAEVRKVFTDYQIQFLIHGHTHRPDIHHIQINGSEYTRIVLGDWYDQGSVLSISEADTGKGFEYHLEQFS